MNLALYHQQEQVFDIKRFQFPGNREGKNTSDLMTLLPEPLRIMVAQFLGLFRSKILLFIGMEMFFHLPDDVFGIMVIPYLQVRGHFGNLERMPAGRAELPLLEPVHIGKRPASRTPENEVHKHDVFSLSPIKIY